MPFDMTLPMIFAFALCAVAVGFMRRSRSGARFRATDYRAKPLITRWELTTLLQIRADLPSGQYACPQVRLADMVRMALHGSTARLAALRHVQSKSVDFATTDLEGRVALVIELDDRSHSRQAAGSGISWSTRCYVSAAPRCCA
jgi:hypothetical protein